MTRGIFRGMLSECPSPVDMERRKLAPRKTGVIHLRWSKQGKYQIKLARAYVYTLKCFVSGRIVDHQQLDFVLRPQG